MSAPPLVIVGIGIIFLLILILRFRVHALPALLVVSIGVGLGAGLAPQAVLQSVTNGMGGTLGFIAVIVGLGGMFGAILQAAGGVEAIARGMLKAFGQTRAGPAMGVVGLIVSIPVFFDVAFIILAPLAFSLAAKTKRSVLVFALPLLAGLAAGHTMIPPTPGPLAVAQLLNADLGSVVLLGIVAGVSATLAGGVAFAWLAERAGLFRGMAQSAEHPLDLAPPSAQLGAGKAILVILTPLLLILLGTSSAAIMPQDAPARVVLGFIGHPFVALLIACALGYAAFRNVVLAEALRDAMAKSLEPAGVIILITGAGGAFKQVLIDTGAGAAMAEAASAANLAPLAAGFVIAGLVRVAQGSATVAMITAAGLVAPLALATGMTPLQLAAVTIAISSGASILSHVNDSGFWLVSRYLQLSEAQTLRTWTIASTLVGLGGFAAMAALYPFL